MVFISRGRGRSGNRGRGRGVGEVAFESRPAHSQGQAVGRDSRQAPESLRITVGNDQFRERKEESISDRLSPSVSQRLGPPKDSYLPPLGAEYRREDDMYRREAEMYARADRERYERDRDTDRRDQYSRDPYARPEEREYGDRRGLGGGQYEQPHAEYLHQPSKPVFPSATRSSPQTFHAAPSPVQAQPPAPAVSRPLKSILKKKSDPVTEEKPQAKPSGLPGIANYMDDIEDEDKFLYGGDDVRERRNSERDRRESGLQRQQLHGVAIEDMRANIISAAQAWQPSAPEKTVSGVVSQFVNAQREFVDSSKSQQFGGQDPYQPQQLQSAAPIANSGGNDLWSMLAKSVQTVQQQQQQPPANQYEPPQGNFQSAFSSQSVQPSFPSQTAQNVQAPVTGHDPTIENILKSIGFDFEMSKRMQEKAKQSSGEVIPQAAKPGDPEFLNQNASFIGTHLSHEEMVSHLGQPPRDRDAPVSSAERQHEPLHGDYSERDMYGERERRGSSEASRGRLDSPPRRISSPSRRTSSPPRRIGSPPRRVSSPPRMVNSPTRRQSPEKLQRGCSPVSAEGSPPPPMFHLPPITIKRRSNMDRSRSPEWDKKRGLSRSPTRDSDRSKNRPRSRSPSWNRSVSSYSRKRSPSPGRKRSVSPQNHSRSPGRRSPIIKRTFNLDDLSPAFRRRVSPMIQQGNLSPVSPERSLSPGRRRNISPGHRSLSSGRRRSPSRRSISPGRRRSPNRRRSRSPGRRRSRSPGRRRSRSPGHRRSRSPRRRSRSPRGRRHSLSPRGRKRGPSSRSRSREKKVRRSASRDRLHRGSPVRGHRSSSRERNRKRSRSRTPRRHRRSVSVSSDSDVDGPANKKYFSSPLRLSREDKQKIPRYYDYPPQQQGPPPDFSAPPFPGYGPPPSSFPPGTQPGMPPVGPPGPPPIMSMPPPGIGPPMGPPVSYPYPPPGPPGPVYAIPGPPNFNQPPPMVSEPDVAPPGTIEMPLNLPNRPNLTEIVSEDKKDDIRKRELEEDRRRDRSRSRERNREKRDERRSEKSSSSSNRTVLPPKSRQKPEDIEIIASTTSKERVVMVGGKSSKSSSSLKEEKKVDQEKERAKILKEQQSMVSKINTLEVEFNNLKKQEFDLKKRTGKDNKPDPILIENKKLLEEIKKEIGKLSKQKTEFEKKHSDILKKEETTRREIKVTPKKTAAKDEKSKAGDKKSEKEEFKVEKGKLMKHYFHDAGDHWCKPCNTLHPNIQDYMHHLASYKHKQTLPSDFRPWMDGYKANDGMIINKKGIRVPLPGIEFMMPVTAYYCQLCKVFLGDVSFGADHFKCESHYINYKKYLTENPIYEKKYKEEREKVLNAHKASKKVEQEKKTKEDVKQKNTEKDARVRENEKKWDKSVEDLDSETSGTKSQETGKKQIKLSLKDHKSEESEKGFGKFNWNKDKKNEDQKNGQKTPEASQEKEKGKINFNISLSGKSSGRTIIGKTGVPKKNPLLPPWQPVGKKSDTLGKPGETASLDQFLTTNTGEGKIPVISEKKKVSAKEILEAFSGKYKEKEIGPSAKKEKDETKETPGKKETSTKEKEETIPKTKKELEEEKEKRMMGIDPDTEKPLAEKKPPPPVSQNVPLPDQKPSATVDENEVHKVFNSEKLNEMETPVTVTIDLLDIPVPDSEKPVMKVVDITEVPIPETEMMQTEENAILKEISVPNAEKPSLETTDTIINPLQITAEVSEPASGVQEMKEDLKEIPMNNKDSKKDSASIDVEKCDIVGPEADDSDMIANVTINSVKTDTIELKEHPENVQTDTDNKTEQIEVDVELNTQSLENAPIGNKNETEDNFIPVKNEEVSFRIVKQDGGKQNEKTDDKSENVQIVETDGQSGGTGETATVEAKSDDSDTEIEEVASPSPTKGRGRGRGRKRGRGRGRGKGKITPVRTTRSSRATKALQAKEETDDGAEAANAKTDTDNVDNVDINKDITLFETDNKDSNLTETNKNSELIQTNKDSKLNLSVEVAKNDNGKNKKSTSPRVRKTSMKSDSTKMETGETVDNEDALSEASGISMHMDSDFEVVDDLEDIEVLDEDL